MAPGCLRWLPWLARWLAAARRGPHGDPLLNIYISTLYSVYLFIYPLISQPISCLLFADPFLCSMMAAGWLVKSVRKPALAPPPPLHTPPPLTTQKQVPQPDAHTTLLLAAG